MFRSKEVKMMNLVYRYQRGFKIDLRYRARRENLYKFTSKNNNKSVKIFAPRRVNVIFCISKQLMFLSKNHKLYSLLNPQEDQLEKSLGLNNTCN